MDFRLCSESTVPFAISAHGNPEFEAYAAGVASDRFAHQARLLVVRSIQHQISRWTPLRFELRFLRPPPLGCTSDADPLLAQLRSTVKSDVRNALQADYPQPESELPYAGGLPYVSVLTDEQLNMEPPRCRELPDASLLTKAVKYVFGPQQMSWTVTSTRGGTAIAPCYKFEKARADWKAVRDADWARCAVVMAVDRLAKGATERTIAAIAAGGLTKDILKQEVERLAEEGLYSVFEFAETGEWLLGSGCIEDDRSMYQMRKMFPC